MKCIYQSESKYCWREKIPKLCSFESREFGCEFARHYHINRKMIERVTKELESPEFVKDGSLMRR